MINLNNSLCLATAAISCSPPSHAINTAIVDTGASDHYFTPGAPLLQVDTAAPTTTIRTATGEAKSSTATAVLAIPSIPTLAARTGHIIPGFTNNLISLGKLCDADCTATITKHAITVYSPGGSPILTAPWDTTGPRLWRAALPPLSHHANGVVTQPTPGPPLGAPDAVPTTPPPPPPPTPP